MVRILVTGDCPTAKAVRGYLARHDFHLTDHDADLTVRIEENTAVLRPLVDSIHCELDQAILRHLRKQTATPIELHTAGGVESDRVVRIVVPPNEQERRAVEISVFRALLEISGQQDRKTLSRWKGWMSRKTK
jgi:RNA-binding protein YlmH